MGIQGRGCWLAHAYRFLDGSLGVEAWSLDTFATELQEADDHEVAHDTGSGVRSPWASQQRVHLPVHPGRDVGLDPLPDVRTANRQ